MDELDPWKWTGHIFASYALTALVLALLVLWLFYDGRRQGRALSELEARGVKRRSDRA